MLLKKLTTLALFLSLSTSLLTALPQSAAHAEEPDPEPTPIVQVDPKDPIDPKDPAGPSGPKDPEEPGISPNNEKEFPPIENGEI